jgi:hypothetical protein
MSVDFSHSIMERGCFNRALNAAFLTQDNALIEFVYRMVKEFLNNSPNTKFSFEEVQATKIAFEKQFKAEFKFNGNIFTVKSLKSFDFLNEWIELEQLVYVYELKNPILRLWSRDDYSFPENEWDRFWGKGWEDRHGFKLTIPDNDYKYPSGYHGKKEYVWQQELKDMYRDNVMKADKDAKEAKREGVGSSVLGNLLQLAFSFT